MFKFEINTWITFMTGGHRLIGRTCVINNTELVGVVDDMGGVGHIEFIQIENPVKIVIPDNFEQNIGNKQIESIEPNTNSTTIKFSYKPSEIEKQIILLGLGGEA